MENIIQKDFKTALTNGNQLLTRRQAAEYLGVTKATLAAWVHHRRYNLTYIKIGRLVKYRKSDLDVFIQDNLHRKG